jgi:hypothetical protein
MGRARGSLVRAKCCVCGTIELARGAGNFSRCQACKDAGRWMRSHYRVNWLGAANAQAAIQHAMRDGILPRPRGLPCADCGGPAIEYEHRDYNKPLEVDPICRACNLRRGPAKPIAGCLHPLVLAGWAPYRQRQNAIRVFQLLGLDPAPLGSYPGRLTNEHWRELLAFVPEGC